MRRILFGNAKRILAILIATCLIAIIGVGCYSCVVFSKSMYKQAEQTALSKMQKVEYDTSGLVSNVEKAVANIRNNRELCDLICEDEEKADNMVAITQYLGESIRGINEITGCAAISPTYKDWVYNVPNWDQLTSLKLQISYDVESIGSEQVRWYSGNLNAVRDDMEDYIMCAFNIPSKVDHNKKAKVYLFVSKAEFVNILSDENENAIVGMLNEIGQIIYVNDEEAYRNVMLRTNNLIYNMYLKGRDNIVEVSGEDDDYIVAYSDSADLGFKFWCMYEKDYFYRDVYNLIAVIVTIIICVSLLLLALSVLLFKCYIIPIQKLANKMRNFKVDEDEQKVTITGSGEIDIIVDSYNMMTDNIKRGVAEIKLKEQEKREVEFKAMRYQINPHFIYNTLSSLKITAISHGEKTISDALTMLSRVLRYSLFCTDKFVKLSQEIDFVKNYISLMNVRFYDRLRADILIDDLVNDAMVPAFFIQPIIENSMVHGLNKKLNRGEECIIEISAFLNGGELLISIKDNGEGIPPEKLEKILEGETGVLNAQKSIGLRNINERIKLAYGNEYGLKIESELGRFTIINIVLPYNGN